jgi:tape measure domain-containing protein
MATIDDKIVAMSFENKKFESGVSQSLSSIDKLKAALKFDGAAKGLHDIDAAGKRIDLGHIGRGVDAIRQRLNALSVAALAVFATIATKAAATGARLVKAFTLDPLKAGFSEYTTNLNAVQTILANTQAAGVGLKEVNKALLELNQYSDKTIYNFSQMAKNIGTFTAAGVELDTATNAIKGIANLAALSGSNAEQASTAMYQLSQAIAAGRVSLMDWNSVVNAGMGGTVFQRALAQTAVAMGDLDAKSLKLVGSMKNVQIGGESFRQSLQAGPGKASWLTSEVLTKTLEQFTGDLSKAELAAMGFNEAQIKSIQQTANTAMKAATEVKTLEGVLTTAKETAGSGWAQTWQIIFGDFGEAKTLFTGISNAVNGFISASANARNKVLSDWKALGGRTLLITSIKTAFQNLGAILKPIKDAFRDIFPAKTGKDLFDMTKRFNEFAKSLKPTETTIENLRRTFRGIFALFSIAKQIIGGVLGVFAQLFGIVGKGTGDFLNFTGGIGDFIVSIDAALKKGDRLSDFFDGIAGFLKAPLELIRAFSKAISDLFSGFSPGGFSDELDGITASLTPFGKIAAAVADTWQAFLDIIGNSGNVAKPAFDTLIEAIQNFGTAFGGAVSNINFEAVFAAVRTGLFAGLVLMLRQFFGKGTFLDQIGKGFGGGILSSITGSFSALQGSMVAMQQNIKAKTLKEIAIAIALLAASVVALSFVDPDRLKSSLAAMTVAFGQLLGAMAILGNISKTMGFIKMPVIAASMILLAGAITLLSAAVVILAQLSWEELAKGLGGVVVLLGALSAASIPLSANSRGMITAGIGITALAVGLNLLALAVRQFASLSWTELAKGLGAVAVGLGTIAAVMRVMPTGRMVLAGAGLIAIATGLNILALAIERLGNLNWRVLGKGLAAVAISLTSIALAMKLMPKSVVFTGAGLLLVAVALQGIARAVEKMGGMSVREIAKGLGTLAGSLIILAGALHLMKGTIGGSIALTAAAAGIALLAPALTLLGKQSWGEILRSLVTLAGALTVLGVAGLLLTPTIPALLGLGAALLLIGGGLALAGAGIALIGVGLSAIAIAGPTAVGILVGALIELSEAIPEFSKNVVLGLLEMVKGFAAVAPQFLAAVVKIIDMILNAIIKSTPKMAEAFTVLLLAGLRILSQNQDRVIQAGLDLILALLQGIRNNIGEIVTVAADIIVNFLRSLSNNMNRIVKAGVDLIISFVKGIGNRIGDVATMVGTIITRFISTIASNLNRITTAGISIITRLLRAIADNLGRVITAGISIVTSIITGIGNAGAKLVTAAVGAIIKFVNALAKQLPKLVDAGFKAIIAFIDGVAKAIDQNSAELGAAGARLGIAIVKGMITGLGGAARELYNKAEEIAGKALSILKKPWKVLSPSKIMEDLGENIILGMANGLAASAPDAYAAAEAVSNGLIDKFNDVFQTASPSKVMYNIGKFVGEGFANGLRGSQSDINAAFAKMNEELTEAMVTARETIAKEQEKLDKLRSEKKPDEAAIRKAQETIKENNDLLARSSAAHTTLVKQLKGEKSELIGLVNDYDKITERLKGAKDALLEATKTRDDAIKGFTDQYSQLPQIVKEGVDAEGNKIQVADQLGPYLDALKFQTDAVAAYQATLDQLRKLGLDDVTYQKLLKEGPENQRFADQLLSGGRTAIQSLNTLDQNLMRVSKTLAVNAGKNLYQAGVDAAAGLVKGLQSKQSDIRKQMETIAREMVRALKKELGIKSPSTVFAEIGRFAMEGMAKGFIDSSKVVTNAIDAAAQNALTTMRNSMSAMSNIVSDELNPNPIITPILDLTQVRVQSRELSALTSAYGQASLISADQQARQDEELIAANDGPSVMFEQNNYSPKALTEVDIYRQTKNQLSQLKTVLNVT